MKRQCNFLFLFLALLLSYSCDNDEADFEFVNVATAEFMSKSEFRNAVDIIAPQPIQFPGKIYAYNDYIFVNDLNKGVHIIDNTNPVTPKPMAYIRIPGNEDISIKNDVLYADSATDLLVFNISNINSISLVERLKDVFTVYNHHTPNEADALDYGDFNYETDVVVGWTLKRERREKLEEFQTGVIFNEGLLADASAEVNVGMGGSLARFQIVNNYLYTVGSYEMAIFNIQNLSSPVLETVQGAGWNIETMFQSDNHLYLGSTNGMYIYSLNNPAAPEYVSEFTHWEGCDPVVVDGDYAYVTLRGGNLCGQDESVLEVIDISDKTTPTLAGRYELENPYGLGIKDQTLFICDGSAGLKLFNKENPLELSLINEFQDIQSKDVIPMDDKLLMIGDKILYQYDYAGNNISLISTYTLN